MSFEPKDPDFEKRVRVSFSRQGIMKTLGAELREISPGAVDIFLPFRDNLSQQHGYLHAGVVATILDSACGYAGLTLMPPASAVLAVEFKVNFMAPATGEAIIAQGRVLKAGRTLIVCEGRAYAETNGSRKLVASMQSTVMAVSDRGIID